MNRIGICAVDENDNVVKFETIAKDWTIEIDTAHEASSDMKTEICNIIKKQIEMDLNNKPIIENLIFGENK